MVHNQDTLLADWRQRAARLQRLVRPHIKGDHWIVGALRGWVLYFAREYDAAIIQCSETLELDPEFYPAHMFISRAYLRIGMCELALQTINDAVRLSGNEPAMMPTLAYTLAVCGQRERALELMARLQQNEDSSFYSSLNLALIHTGLGNVDDAITWFKKAVDERYPWVVQIRVDPTWDPLREDPRFHELEKSIGLPIGTP